MPLPVVCERDTLETWKDDMYKQKGANLFLRDDHTLKKITRTTKIDVKFTPGLNSTELINIKNQKT